MCLSCTPEYPRSNPVLPEKGLGDGLPVFPKKCAKSVKSVKSPLLVCRLADVALTRSS